MEESERSNLPEAAAILAAVREMSEAERGQLLNALLGIA